MILPPWQHEFLHLSVLLHLQLGVIDLMLNLIDGTVTSILIVSCLVHLACGTPFLVIISLQRTIMKKFKSSSYVHLDLVLLLSFLRNNVFSSSYTPIKPLCLSGIIVLLGIK